MADRALLPKDLQILRRCPTTVVDDRRHTDRFWKASVERLQRMRLIRVIPRADLKAGAGRMADVVLTEAGRAALAAALAAART